MGERCIFDDPGWHLDEVEKGLDSASRWLEETMPADPPIEELRKSFTAWMTTEGEKIGLDEGMAKACELANPPGMSAAGLQRYWRKVRMAG